MFEKISQYISGVQVEIRKVSWLSKDEMMGSTIIVGIFSALVSIFLFVVDFGLTEFVSRLLGGKKSPMEWYSLRVISGKEKNAQEDILREASNNDVAEQIDEVFVPFEKVVAMRNNKKVVKEKMFFPGYILINMEMTPQSRYVVENTPGVIRFVGPKGGEPVPLREDEIKRIFGEVERKEGREILDSPYIRVMR